MNILMHCGVGNTDRPSRWTSINNIFSDLGESLIKLGHNVSMIVHPAAHIQRNKTSSVDVTILEKNDSSFINSKSPDLAITWNGNSNGDMEFINIVGRDKMIFSELGYFGHYNKTCYFDRCGTNTRHSIIGRNISEDYLSKENDNLIHYLQNIYAKPKLINDPYIFIPLQDETDTQITQFSPFTTMDEFLHHVFDIFRFDNRKILYKLHPMVPSIITLRHPKVIAVTEDVHHYIPYADIVFGLNSTVMVESLLYHGNIVTYGAGVASRSFTTDIQRKNYIAKLYKQQIEWRDLKIPEKVKSSYLYSIMTVNVA